MPHRHLRRLSSSNRFSVVKSSYARRLRAEQLEDRRMLAITVDTLGDTVDAGDGLTSLREAIASATAGETIDFSVAGTIRLSDSFGTLTINKALVIDGGNQITIDAGNGSDGNQNTQDGFRIINVDDQNLTTSLDVTLRGLALTGGDPSDRDLFGAGGAIRNEENLTLERSTLSGNAALNGGGIINFGVLTVTESTLANNTARASGGGLFNNGSATATIERSTFSENSGVTGGAIIAFDGVLITNSTLSANVADGRGGGVAIGGGTTTITSSTLSGNSAGIEGGGIFVNAGTATLNSTIVANSPEGGDIQLASGVSIIGFNNLVEDGSGGIGAITGDPLLGPLADNGGPTQTHALLPGSPALDMGDLNFSSTTDQRGLPRVVDGDNIAGPRDDIGAFELNETPGLFVTTADDVDDETDQVTSLREAIQFANQLPGADTITFDAEVFSGGDDSLIRLTNGELEITDTITIDSSTGTGVTITGDANDDDITNAANITDVAASLIGADRLDDNSRVLNFSADGGDLTLRSLMITGGRTAGSNEFVDGQVETTHSGGGIRFQSDGTLTLTSSTLSGNSTAGDLARGGGIATISGAVTLTDSTVSGNSTTGFGAEGGGIYTVSGAVTLTSSTLSGNSTAGYTGDGGGIYTVSGAVTLTSSTLSGNSTAGGRANGGGIYTGSGAVTLTSSTLSGNSTAGDRAYGGGIASSFGPVTLTSSTVSGNTGDRGGGIFSKEDTVTLDKSTVSGNTSSGSGGGIYTFVGNVTLTSSTVSGNTSGSNGGGIRTYSGTVTINQSTLSGNKAMGRGGGVFVYDLLDPSFAATNSIIAGNTDNGSAPDLRPDPGGSITVTNSLIGDNTGTPLPPAPVGMPDANGNLIGASGSVIDPLLGPLADNGGPTQTHALLPDSPAIDAGDTQAVNVADRGAAAQTSEIDPLATFPAGNAIDGDFTTFTHTSANQINPTWILTLDREHLVSQVLLFNRTDTAQERLRDIVVQLLDADENVVASSGLLNPGNFLNGPPVIPFVLGTPVLATRLVVARISDPLSSGSDANVLSLAEVQVFSL